jgi:hypothetical protein
MGDGWSSLRFKSSFVILAFSNRIFGRHSVLSSNGKYGAKWFRDDNFTFLIVFFEVKSKGLMVSWMVTQQAEALDKGNSRRPAAMVKSVCISRRRNECRTAGSSRAPLKVEQQ